LKAEIPTIEQLLTAEELLRILPISRRSLARLTGGRKRKPQIAITKVGGQIFYPAAGVLEYIVSNTVRADNGYGYQGRRLAAEDMEVLWERIVRLVRVEVERVKTPSTNIQAPEKHQTPNFKEAA